MNNLPEGYKEGIPRVSNIVSFIYPFTGEGKKRYLQWVYKELNKIIIYNGDVDINKTQEIIKEFPDLAGLNIGHLIQCEEDYITEAQTVGTYIHQIMEDYILGKEVDTFNPLLIKHLDVIKGGYVFIDQLKEKYTEKEGWEFIAEPVLRDEYGRYQGSSDLVLINEGLKKVIIYDWKTFGIAKARWNLPNVYRKPYDKIKKGALQFSLYAETYRQRGYEIEGIKLVYLHQSKAYEYELNLYSTEELNNILEKYIIRDDLLPSNVDIIFNYNPMRIEINTVIPGEAYSNARIIMESEDLKNNKSIEDNIEEVIRLQKYLISKY